MGKNSKITAKDLYKEAWDCRNFEINNLWQRSIFLGAFMLAIATGYGTLILKMVFLDTCTESNDLQNQNTIWISHLMAIGICYLGYIFSILWIMMTKGSKYWFERYEAAIDYFVDCYDYPKKKNRLFSKKAMKWCEKKELHLKIGREFPRHGKLPEKDSNKNLLSPKGGTFSVSKINCMIGIVGIIVWSCLNVIHGIVFFRSVFSINNLPECLCRDIVLSSVQCFIISKLLSYFLRHKCSRS